VSYGVADFRARAAEQLAELRKAKARVDELRTLHDDRRALLLRRREEATEELTRALLPELTQERLAWAARVTGFPGLVQKDFVGRADAERHALNARIAEIEADPRWRDRKLLRDPGVGTLTRAIAELQEFREPFAAVVATCRHPRLPRLLETGYGTSRYAVPFWRMSYYADWKAGDELLERFPGRKEFADVLAEYLEAVRTLETYDPKLESLKQEYAAGARLEEELGASRQGLESLEARWHGLARIALAEHLESLPQEALGGVLEAVPALGVLAKKWAGLDHQVRYLEAIRDVNLQPEYERLFEAIRKLEKDVAKYLRPNKSGTVFPAEAFEKRFDPARTEKLRKRIERYGEAQEKVWSFERYERGSFASDFLWWDLLTDGRIDGDFIPEVKRHHESHPGHRYERGLDDGDLASAGAAVSTAGSARDGLLDAS
jgi:hypothetical protein